MQDKKENVIVVETNKDKIIVSRSDYNDNKLFFSYKDGSVLNAKEFVYGFGVLSFAFGVFVGVVIHALSLVV